MSTQPTNDIAGTITVDIRSNYGVEAIYPVCEAGKLMLQLTGRKTYTRNDIADQEDAKAARELHLDQGK